MNDAGTALRGITADVRAGQPQAFADQFDQQGPAFDVLGHRLVVHCQGYFWHDRLVSDVSCRFLAMNHIWGP